MKMSAYSRNSTGKEARSRLMINCRRYCSAQNSVTGNTPRNSGFLCYLKKLLRKEASIFNRLELTFN